MGERYICSQRSRLGRRRHCMSGRVIEDLKRTPLFCCSLKMRTGRRPTFYREEVARVRKKIAISKSMTLV